MADPLANASLAENLLMEETLRNIIMAGATGLLLALDATGDANAANQNVPASSPYALLDVAPSSAAPDNGPGYPNGGYRNDPGPDHGITERHAAYAGAGLSTGGLVATMVPATNTPLRQAPTSGQRVPKTSDRSKFREG
jgi:hypothetical protein